MDLTPIPLNPQTRYEIRDFFVYQTGMCQLTIPQSAKLILAYEAQGHNKLSFLCDVNDRNEVYRTFCLLTGGNFYLNQGVYLTSFFSTYLNVPIHVFECAS